MGQCSAVGNETTSFLRTTEFFWQEGHTAHETYEQAQEEVLMMLNEYVDLCTNYLAIPVIAGQKSESEKFPGAEMTLTFEGIMQDGKALQMGTSHLLSQNFAHVSHMQYQDKEGQMVYPYLTSWGTTTRLVGAVVMVHGDAKGLVLPPKIAPIQVIIIPILKKNADNDAVLAMANTIDTQLKAAGVRSKVDATDKSPGTKFYHWEMKGVPLKLEIGPRDLEAQQAIVADRLGLAKETVPLAGIHEYIAQKLESFHRHLLQRATEKRASLWKKAEKLVDFGPQLDAQPSFYQTGWCGKRECEMQLKQFKATTRCLLKEITFDQCFNCDQPNKHDVIVAKSY